MDYHHLWIYTRCSKHLKWKQQPLYCLFYSNQGCFFVPKTLARCSPKSRAGFLKSTISPFFTIQYCFHLSVSMCFHLETAVEDKRLNKIVQSSSIILLCKHRTPDLITRLLGEECLSFSCCHLHAVKPLQTIRPYLPTTTSLPALLLLSWRQWLHL